MIYPNMFHSVYEKLEGRDWIRRVSPEDRRIFVERGLAHAQWGKLGGIARAKTALRDRRGRFAKNGY